MLIAADPGHWRGVCTARAGRGRAGRGGDGVLARQRCHGAPPRAAGGPPLRHLLRRGRRRSRQVRLRRCPLWTTFGF